MRAISRRTPSKLERTTAAGVSSMITSTPVSFSSVRMLRPSRPMIRPFISSLGSSTRRVVLSPACLAASRCIATERMFRARRSASRLVSASISWSLTPAWWRASFSTSASSSCLAWEALRPEMRSSSRRCTRLARFSSSDWWLRLRSRSSSAFVRRSRSPRCTSSDSRSRRACSSIRAISARRAGELVRHRDHGALAHPAGGLAPGSSPVSTAATARVSPSPSIPFGRSDPLLCPGPHPWSWGPQPAAPETLMSAIALGRLGQARILPLSGAAGSGLRSRFQSL